MTLEQTGSRFLLFLVLYNVINTTSALSFSSTHPLHTAVHHFNTLHKDHVKHRTIRDNMYSIEHNSREIKFNTLGRQFRLILSPHTKSFHPYASANILKSGSYERSVINHSQFLRGHVFGEEYSDVLVHVTDDGIMTGFINVNHDSYYIEPSHRHIKESHDFHMITYRGSDVKYNMTGSSDSHFCGVCDSTTGYHGDVIYQKQKPQVEHWEEPQKWRLRRQSSDDIRLCPINLVATTSFHEAFGGQGLREDTTNYLLTVMLKVDDIFRSDNNNEWFIPDVTDSAVARTRGIEIANVTVITEDDESAPSYNSATPTGSEALLQDFSRTNWNEYCLSHLFTATTFSDSSRLGVGYIAQTNSFVAGGICSRNVLYNNRPFSGNTAISVYRNSDNRLLLLAESVIVTAHEIGHNWGSNHDPETCSPSQEDGGKFLMYAVAQDGSSSNNKRFSECSIRAISQVLRTHEEECFSPPSSSRCGDFRIDVEDGEQCDPGPTAVLHDGDACCTIDCLFRNDSIRCSDVNHNCCQDCQPKSNTTICEEFEAGNTDCFDDKLCDGTNVTCPTVDVFVPEGSTCGFMGLCLPNQQNQIECVNFCELQNQTSCHCSGSDECRLCCADTANNSSCAPYDPIQNLPAGSFCEGGNCNSMGECELSDPDLSTFLFDLFNDFSTSALSKVLAENIVLSVIILSLMLWIPVSVFVHVFDVWWDSKRKKSKLEKSKKGAGSSDEEVEKLLEKQPLDTKDEKMPSSFFQASSDYPDYPDPQEHNILFHIKQ